MCIPDDLNLGANGGSEFSVGLEVILVEGILNGDHRELLNEFLVEISQLLSREHLFVQALITRRKY